MPLCICGMHRSGTSMVAHTLSRCGIYLGPEEVIRSSAPDNQDGFWEDSEFVAINDAILEQGFGGWDAPPFPKPGWEGSLELAPLREKALELIGKRCDRAVWGWKDPRSSLTLPFWQSLAPDLKVLICVRNPLESAVSLHRRNGLSVQFGLRLWYVYQSLVLAATQPGRRLVTHYEAHFSDPRAEIRRILAFLEVESPEAHLEEAVRTCRASLRHEQGNPDLRQAMVPADLVELYEALCAEAGPVYRQSAGRVISDPATGGVPREANRAVELPRATSDMFALWAEQASIVRQVVRECLHGRDQATLAERDRLARELTAREHRLEQTTDEVFARDVRLQESHAEIVFRDAEIRRLSVEQARRVNREHHLSSQLAARDREIDRLTDEAAAKDDEICQWSAEAAARGNEIRRLTDEAQLRDREIRRAGEEWIRQNQEIDRLNGCLSAQSQELDLLRRRSARGRWLTALKDLLSTSTGRRECRRLAGRFWTYFRQEGAMRALRCTRHYLSRPGAQAAGSLPAPALPVTSAADPKAAYTASCRIALDAFLMTGARLQFPTVDRPTVSVILVLHNRAELTLACLRSLLACDSPPFEAILVDNGSSDQTAQLLASLEGIKIVRNEQNEGFSPAVNQAAAMATGDYLLLLNNDTQLLTNGLRVAAEFLENHEDVGAVGGRILLLDGRLQEAGSMVWQDGSTQGYGRGDYPYASAYMHRREVDFCSGAFLMTPRALFLEMGGFDREFYPAYYEDVDYCVRLWRGGRKVVYHPGITLLHYEYGSSNSSTSAVALMAEKKEVFVRRHADWLTEQHPASRAGFCAGRRARDRRKRILVVDDRVPHPWLGAGFPRAHRILRRLVDLDYAVTFYPMTFPQPDWPEAYRSVPGEVEIAFGRGEAGLGRFLEERHGLYDLVLVSRPHNMRTLRTTVAGRPDLLAGARIVYDAEALFALREAKQAAIQGRPFSARELGKRLAEEVRLADIADAVISVCDAEAEQFRRHNVPTVYTLGLAVAASPGPAPFELRRGLLFVGPVHDPGTPNGDSVRFLLSEVMPRLEGHRGTMIDIAFAGAWCSRVTPRGADLSCARVLGRVDDLTSVYNEARVFVAPTRFSAGLPHKVHEAAAHGLPCIVSSLLAEQLGWTHEKEVLVADDADEFAEQCRRLHEDARLWQHLREAALDAVRRDCSPERFDRQLEQLVAQVLAGADDQREILPMRRKSAA